MPFLKKRKVSIVERRIEASKRNGWRCAIFGAHWYPKNRYNGQWKNDKREGRGLEISRKSFSYQGDWLSGVKSGYGVLKKIIKNDHPKNVYSGYWCRGKKHGFGIHWYPDGIYKGCFLQGKRHGFGKMWWSDGRYYEGDWKDGHFNGKGILIFSNGNQYEGQFVCGKREKQGKYFHKKTGQLQVGTWKSDICVSSSMKDFYFRQFAPEPSPYPIPHLQENGFM